MVEFWYQRPVTAEFDYIMKCALKAEELGFDGVTHEDHFWVLGIGSGCRPECWTFLTAVAMKTNLKVAPLVACIPYRYPVLLAKIITTLDRLSKGRVTLIYGAGWWKEESQFFGYKWEPGKVRFERTVEAIRLIEKLWTEDEVTFEGKYYTVRNCRLVPRPYQKPRPPIISGGIRFKMRKFAAQHDDGWIFYGEVSGDSVKKFAERKKMMDRYIKGREFKYGVFMHFRKRHTIEELRRATEGFINLGAEIIILRLDPHDENLERLDEVAEIINDLRGKYH